MNETDIDVSGEDDREPEEVTLDRLSGAWWIYQLRRGHRYNTDDVVTAWTASRARPRALRLLDLGSGVGSIGLMTLWLMPPEARLVAIEVQPESIELARRTVARNELEHRVDLRWGDLRDSKLIEADERFDVIMANPPFLPPGTGWVSTNPQRGAAKFELHGDVFDYCRVAARHLAMEGRFCLCHSATDSRPEQAISDAGMKLLCRRDVTFRRGRPPRIALFLCGRDGEAEQGRSLTVRDEEGQRTAEYVDVLRQMDIVE